MRDGFLIIERVAQGNSIPVQSGNTPGIPDILTAVTGGENPGFARGNSMRIIIKFFTPLFRSGNIQVPLHC
jgi:hypothetical protein